MTKIVICVTIIITIFSYVPVFAADQIEKVLPAPSCADGWSLNDKVTLYTKDNLFDRIDGEAEIYFPYGFEIMASARYASKQNPQHAVEADVYRMGSLLDAFGIYASYRRADDEDAAVGAESTLAPSQLLFYQDRYFVRLQATGTLSIDRDVFLSCARAIASKLPPGSGRPVELQVTDIPSIAKKSERYIAQSLLGYPFFRRGIMADAAAGSDQIQIFVVTEETPDAARRSFDQYLEYLQKSGANASVKKTGEQYSLEADDPLYGKVMAETHGSYIFGAIRIKDWSSARRLISQLKEKR